MPLTDTAVRQTKPRDTNYSLTDADGLSLFVSVKGTKAWHFRFTWKGKQFRISLGTYPELSLKEARARRDECRAKVAKGVDPRGTHRPDSKANPITSFSDVSDEWHGFKSGRWADDSRRGSGAQSRRVLDNDILPFVGSKPFADVHRRDLVAVVGRIEERGALNIAEKARSWLRQICRYGIAKGLREDNPASDLDILAVEAPPVRHNPILSHQGEDLTKLLVRLRHYGGSPVTQDAVWLLLYTAVRTIELRKARPGDFNLDTGIWTVPPTRVKQLRGRVRRDGEDVPDYIVPLSRQALIVVERCLKRSGRCPFLFPGRNDPQTMMSENTINLAIKRMGLAGKLTGHGLRGTISTALNEMGYKQKWVDSQLSHADPDKTSGCYNHAEYVDERRRMMQAWADYLDLREKGAL
ncbi:tyrosine-type recombinase/integrase [Pseudomonas aeruginosa]|uniref:tyrosine-type recombinase/integrase n=1 Tax=Pseudomonas aeruginosa TaxID=287 RepID=UPI00249861EF|nr:integrase arm-type DNA-binding domain-containing protein [Pseudomonas aeruginosa]MDI2359827.1 integrase arm-type DNA-binding domain-containing protein [Pseudomonas aeruginosa]MDI2365950.1 integrase arm-type DNA-binding domain-containing protein [Pseudomonas aeruginosa]